MTISIFVSGDIVIRSNNDRLISDELRDIILLADLSVCNFEAPIESKGSLIPKAGPHINQSRSSVNIAKKWGFDIFSLSNNHIYDHGEMGLKETIDEIVKNDLEYIGAGSSFDEAYSLTMEEIDDTKIGFLAFCEAEFGALLEDEGRGGYAWINHQSVNNIVRKSKQKVDVLILIAHAGAEEVPLPLPEWRTRYRELCDLGVDVIIGHHPHVPQGWEKYNSSLIFYSLGNFYFDWGGFKNRADTSYSVLLKLDNEKIDYKIITHKKINNCLEIINDESFNAYLDKLNTLLKDNYSDISNQQSIYLYKTRYECYYKAYAMTTCKNTRLISKLYRMIRQLFFSTKDTKHRQLLLLHNVRIESHRFATQRALSLLTEKNYDENYNQFEKILTEWPYK